MNRSTPPPVKPFGPLTIPDETVEVLPNGITLHHVSGGEQPVCSISVFFPGGIAEYGDMSPRIMLSTMADGARDFADGELARLLDFNGVRIGSLVHGHWSTLRMAMLTHRAPEVLPLLKAIITAPLFPDERVEVEKMAMAARLETALANVATLADMQFDTLIMGEGHPLAQRIDPEAARAVSRGSIVDLHRSMLAPAGMHVFVAGLLDDALLDAIRFTFASISGNTVVPESILIPNTAAPAGTQAVDATDSLQSAIATGMPAIARSHPDYIPLRLTAMALGGYFGSRLMTNIREEKGLTYGISAFLAGSQEGSYIKIAARCDKSYTATVIDEIKAELERMASNPPEGEELERVRLHAASSLAETLDSPLAIIGYHANRLTIGTPADYFNAQQRAIAELTPELIARMSAQYLRPDELRTAIAGA